MQAGDLIPAIDRLATSKCQTFHITFGMFKANRGPTDYTSLLVIKDKYGRNATRSITSMSMVGLLRDVYEYLNSIKQPS